jgi:opacity protein-like surface antigen
MQRIARLVYLIALFFISTSFAHAQKPKSPAEIYNGFFIGLAAGPALISADNEVDTTIDYIETVANVTPTPFILHHLEYTNTLDVEDVSIPGRLSAGYGWCVGNCWYMAFELSVFGSGDSAVTEEIAVTETVVSEDPNDTEITELNWKNSVTPALGAQGALDFKTGFFLSRQFLVYARLGLAVADVEITSVLQLETVSTEEIGLIGAADFETTDSEVAGGFHIGLGVEQQIIDELGVIFEYTYVNYGSFNVSHSVPTYINTGLPTVTEGFMTTDTTVTLSQQTLWIGVNYHF